jgi:hypothetical protein
MREVVPDKPRPARAGDAASGRRTTTTARQDAQPPGPGIRNAAIGGALVLLVAVGGILAWLLIPATPPPEPPVDRIALLRTAAGQALQGFPCARLSVQVSQTGDVDVTGYVASVADGQQVTGRLQALSDVGRINNQVAVMRPPLCDALGILADSTSVRLNDAAGPQIDPGGALGTYFAGQNLRIGVTATSLFKGYLYIDYIDGAEGYVVHLFPNEFRQNNAVEAGARVDIGTLPQEIQGYRVKAPFGTSLVIAVSTPEPLFGALRPTFEEKADAKQYLAELGRQLERLKAAGYQNSLLGSYGVLTLREN